MKCTCNGAFPASTHFIHCFEKETTASLDEQYITPLLSDDWGSWILFISSPALSLTEREETEKILYSSYFSLHVFETPGNKLAYGPRQSRRSKDGEVKGGKGAGGFFWFFLFNQLKVPIWGTMILIKRRNLLFLNGFMLGGRKGWKGGGKKKKGVRCKLLH